MRASSDGERTLRAEDGSAWSPAESTKRRQAPRKPRAVRTGQSANCQLLRTANALIDRIAGGWSAARRKIHRIPPVKSRSRQMSGKWQSKNDQPGSRHHPGSGNLKME